MKPPEPSPAESAADDPGDDGQAPSLNRGCRAVVIALIAVPLLVWAGGRLEVWRIERRIARTSELMEQLKGGKFHGTWEGRWSWNEAQHSRIVLDGLAMTVENFPDREKPPVNGPVAFRVDWEERSYDPCRIWIISGEREVFVTLTPERDGKPEFLYRHDVSDGSEIRFRQVP